MTVLGDAFARHMVRNIVGTLVEGATSGGTDIHQQIAAERDAVDQDLQQL